VYPTGFANQFNNNIYHFYVPAHLSTLMREQGVAPRFTAMALTILTATYEFISLKDDGTYLYRDPERLTQTWGLRDIHSAFNGARFGLGFNNVTPYFALLKQSFAQSTSEGMKLLFQHLPK
jgi:hypothetical protein